MVDHSLAIQSFRSRIALTGLREEAPRLGTEVSRAVREMLPEAVGRALEPLLGSREGVLRIDRIALKLRLDRGTLSAALLAELLARQIAEAVAQRATGSDATPRAGPGFAFWPDHASYAASYIALRLGLAPAPAWAFPDLKPLVHLAPNEAALELIVARPAILSALARHLGPGAATTLATRLSEMTASLLVERLAAALPASLSDAALETIASMLAAMPVDPNAGPGFAVVAAAVAWLATQPAQDADNVRRVVLLAQIAATLAAIKAVAVGEWGRPPREADLRPEAYSHLPEPARRLAQAVLTPLTADAGTRAALAEVLGATSSPPVVADFAAPSQAAGTAVARSISSLMAGIGLLIPAALAHDLPGLLSPAALHRTLVAAAGRDVEPMVRLDPLLAALAPFDPRGPSAIFPPGTGHTARRRTQGLARRRSRGRRRRRMGRLPDPRLRD